MNMLKKSLIAIAVLAIAMPAFAGAIKIHEPWPTTYQEVTICKIDVQLDVGFYIKIKDQNPIEIYQDGTIGNKDPYTNYSGCKTTDVISNFAAQLSVKAASKGTPAGGSYSATITPNVVPAGTTPVQICVQGTNVNIGALTGGAKNVKVAEVTVSVMPAA